MKKAIFRIQKLKSSRSVSGCLKHNFRDLETPNADLDKLDQNEVLAGPKTAIEAMQNYSDNLPEKIRKNAVMAIECLSTASPEFFETASQETQKQFFADSLKFIEDKFGKENIVSAVIHRDESTPHLQTLVIPLVEGKLNAKKFVGGSKHELSNMQTAYHEKVAHHGLERGQIKSKANHVTIKEFYTDIDQTKVNVKNELRTSKRKMEMAQSSNEFTGKKNENLESEIGDLKAENKGLLARLAEAMKEIKNTIYSTFIKEHPHARERNDRARNERGRESINERNKISSPEIRNTGRDAGHRDNEHSGPSSDLR